jgi:hypothetical protein
LITAILKIVSAIHSLNEKKLNRYLWYKEPKIFSKIGRQARNQAGRQLIRQVSTVSRQAAKQTRAGAGKKRRIEKNRQAGKKPGRRAVN